MLVRKYCLIYLTHLLFLILKLFSIFCELSQIKKSCLNIKAAPGRFELPLQDPKSRMLGHYTTGLYGKVMYKTYKKTCFFKILKIDESGLPYQLIMGYYLNSTVLPSTTWFYLYLSISESLYCIYHFGICIY